MGENCIPTSVHANSKHQIYGICVPFYIRYSCCACVRKQGQRCRGPGARNKHEISCASEASRKIEGQAMLNLEDAITFTLTLPRSWGSRIHEAPRPWEPGAICILCSPSPGLCAQLFACCVLSVYRYVCFCIHVSVCERLWQYLVYHLLLQILWISILQSHACIAFSFF